MNPSNPLPLSRRTAAVLAQTGFEPMRTSPAQAQAYFCSEMARVPRWIRELGVEPQ